MKHYYVELSDLDTTNFVILSYGITSGEYWLESILRSTDGYVKEITEKEFIMLSACQGNIQNGIKTLTNLRATLNSFILNQQ